MKRHARICCTLAAVALAATGMFSSTGWSAYSSATTVAAVDPAASLLESLLIRQKDFPTAANVPPLSGIRQLLVAASLDRLQADDEEEDGEDAKEEGDNPGGASPDERIWDRVKRG
jgi:hypothetical protein